MSIRIPLALSLLPALSGTALGAQELDPDDVLYGYIGSGADSTFARYELRWQEGELEIAFAPYGQVPKPLDDVQLTEDRARLSFRWPDGSWCELERSPTEGHSWRGLIDIHWEGQCARGTGDPWAITVGTEGPPDYGQYRPADTADLRIIDQARELLATEDAWNRSDDRVCEDDDRNHRWSLFCALYRASHDVTGEYLHARRGLDLVRLAARESTQLQYVHTLLQYNNDPETTLSAIREVLRRGRAKVERELYNPFR